MNEAGRPAILNGFGRSLGDGIVGLQALSVALSRRMVGAHPVLFRLPGLPPILQALYAAAEFAEIRDLDWSVAAPVQAVTAAAAFAPIYDLRDFAFDPAFRDMAMIDYFLARLGVDPAAVAAGQRRNTWLAPRLPAPAPHTARNYVLVCPTASMPLRAMPYEVHAEVLRRLQPWPVATQGEPPVGSDAIALPVARTLAELCGWVAHAAFVVSTDTAMVHLADAYSVPCLAIFTTHRPQRRVRDYPLCSAIHRPAAGLPHELEFARTPADVAATRAAWFDENGDLAWLDAALGDMTCST